MEGPKVEPNEQLSEQGWLWLAKRSLIAVDRRLKMSFFDLNCYGLTCKNVFPALGGEHFSKKSYRKRVVAAKYGEKAIE